MRLRFIVPGIIAAAAALAPSPAEACGGCFIAQSESTVVTGHRMALSVSPDQSVLWDQIQYAGDPSEFAWILPVKPGAVIQASTDAWFEALEAATVATVLNPSVTCTPPSRGCGMFASAFESAGGDFGKQSPPVTVVHQGTVGPYETVTLSTDQPGALNAWLEQHGYNIDDDIQPVIDAYVAEKFDFIAIRLLPGKDVRQMKPVRIVTPGASPVLPLRMVAAGTGSNVAITLYTIGGGRLEVDKYANRTIDPLRLIWDFAGESSNYADVRKQVLAENAGLTWLTTFSFAGAFFSQVEHDDLFTGASVYGFDEGLGATLSSIAELYVSQGIENGEATLADCQGVFSSFSGLGQGDRKVENPCPLGAPPDDPACGEVVPGNIDARELACGSLDDLAAAFAGLHAGSTTLTRLEADLPRLALASDLTLVPTPGSAHVDNVMRATIMRNIEDVCPASVSPVPLDKNGKPLGPDPEMLLVLGAAAIFAAGGVRRITRRAAAR